MSLLLAGLAVAATPSSALQEPGVSHLLVTEGNLVGHTFEVHLHIGGTWGWNGGLLGLQATGLQVLAAHNVALPAQGRQDVDAWWTVKATSPGFWAMQATLDQEGGPRTIATRHGFSGTQQFFVDDDFLQETPISGRLAVEMVAGQGLRAHVELGLLAAEWTNYAETSVQLMGQFQDAQDTGPAKELRTLDVPLASRGMGTASLWIRWQAMTSVGTVDLGSCPEVRIALTAPYAASAPQCPTMQRAFGLAADNYRTWEWPGTVAMFGVLLTVPAVVVLRRHRR